MIMALSYVFFVCLLFVVLPFKKNKNKYRSCTIPVL